MQEYVTAPLVFIDETEPRPIWCAARILAVRLVSRFANGERRSF
jgi:hypothetical protein